jgi:hypothetical protein
VNYRELNKWLRTATLEAINLQLQKEVSGECRKTYMKRLHQRYWALRAAQERKELGI